MNELQVFNNPEFGQLRTLVIDEMPWAVGKDVATALGYSNTTKAIRDHVDDEDKQLVKKNDSFPLNVASNFGVYIINESGLYSLILSSKLPSAKRFKRWVTSEVLPAIRKTGSYALPEAEPPRVLTPDDYLTAARILSGCRNERLPYVLPLIRKAGIPVDIATQSISPQRGGMKDPQTAKLLDVALTQQKLSIRALERLTGISNVQLYRMRDGTSRYNAERAAIVRDVIHTLLPELDIDAITADTE